MFSVSAQTTRVVKVLDSNLFELEDGRLVKLAGIDAPNSSHPFEFYKTAAQDAVEYSNMELLNRLVTTETLYKLPGKDFEIVMMYKKYFLSNVNVSTRYLLYGYGKFFDNVDAKSKKEFLDFQKSAIDEKRGIWLNDNLSVSDTLDSDLVQNHEKYSPGPDPRLEYKIKRPLPLHVLLPSELLAGAGFTAVSVLGSALIGATLFKAWGALIGIYYGSIISYGIGFPTGVYLVAKIANPDLSYLATVGFSLGVTAITTAFTLAVFPNDHDHPTRYIALASPIIGSMLYTNLIAPNPSVRSSDSVTDFKQNITHKDYYNSTMFFNAEIIRINLW